MRERVGLSRRVGWGSGLGEAIVDFFTHYIDEWFSRTVWYRAIGSCRSSVPFWLMLIQGQMFRLRLEATL